MNSPPKRRLDIVEFIPAHADALAAFYRQVWDPAATAASVLAGRDAVLRSNPAAEGRLMTVLAVLDDAVIGHFTSYPERLRLNGRERRVDWTAGFHVLPEHRSGPIGALLAKEMARVAPHSMCTTVLDAPLRLFTALGWKHVGTVPNDICIVRPAEVARRLPESAVGASPLRRRALRLLQRSGLAGAGGALAGVGLHLWASSARGARLEFRTIDAVQDWEGAADADALWRRCATDVAAGVARTGARVRWRFREADYVLLEARRGAALTGWVVLRRPSPGGSSRLGGLRVAPVSDLMYDPSEPAVGLSLLRAAVRYAADGFADAVVASTPHLATRRLLRRLGFVPAAGNLHLVVHGSLLADAAPAFGDWWHHRGDGDADLSF